MPGCIRIKEYGAVNVFKEPGPGNLSDWMGRLEMLLQGI
jgi:hypothetical protein